MPINPVAREDVRGRDVAARDGKTLGKVDDLILEPQTGRVRLLVVAGGGILGFGKRHWPVPVDAVEDISPDTVFLDIDSRALDAAPTMLADLADRAYLGEVYEFYGRRPFWAPGYVAPDWTTPDRGLM